MYMFKNELQPLKYVLSSIEQELIIKIIFQVQYKLSLTHSKITNKKTQKLIKNLCYSEALRLQVNETKM